MLCCLPHTTLLWWRNGFAFKDSVLFWEKFRGPGWNSTRTWRWGGFCSEDRKEVFAATESLVLIDNLTNVPPHILSSISAFKVLLAAHLSIVKTYRCWMWMPSYFQPSHKSCRSSSAERWCYLLPLINGGLSLSLICLAEALGLYPDAFWPVEARPGHTGRDHSLDWYRQRLIRSG